MLSTKELYKHKLHIKINKTASKIEKQFYKCTRNLSAKVYAFCKHKPVKNGYLKVGYGDGFTNEAEFGNLTDLKEYLQAFLDIDLLKYVWS